MITCIAYWPPHPPETLFLLSFAHSLQRFELKKDINGGDKRGQFCCTLYRADRMCCRHRPRFRPLNRQTNQNRICLLCVYHVIKSRVSGFDKTCICVRVCVPSPVSSSVLHSPVWPTSNLIAEMKRHPISPLSVHIYLPHSHLCQQPYHPRWGATDIHPWVSLPSQITF